MAQQATEIAYLPLVAGTDLAKGDVGTVWQETLATIASQPGCESVYWGLQIEHPDVVQLAIVWDTLDAHKAFMASPTYGPFLEKVKPLLAGEVKIHHVQLPTDQPFSSPASAPITECISAYLEPSHSKSAYDANFAKFRELGLQYADENQGLVGGWGVEEHDQEKVEGGKAILFAAFVGWPSVQAHLNFRETDGFKEIIPYMRAGPKAVQVHHVAFEKY